MSVVWNVGFCFCCSKHAQFCTSGIWCYSSHLQGSPCSNYVAAYQGSAISGMILTGLFSLLFILLIWQYGRLPCFDWLSLLTLAIVVCLCMSNCVVCQHIPSGISSPKGSKEVTYKIMQGILMGMIASLTSTTFSIAEYTEIRKHVNFPYCHESQPKHVLDFLGWLWLKSYYVWTGSCACEADINDRASNIWWRIGFLVSQGICNKGCPFCTYVLFGTVLVAIARFARGCLLFW